MRRHWLQNSSPHPFLDERFRETYWIRYCTFGFHPGSRALARVAKPHRGDSSTVIARSPCDEAIHRAAHAALHCCAHRTALGAAPVAHNDGLNVPHFIASFFVTPAPAESECDITLATPRGCGEHGILPLLA
jgi:hypothetical protein